MNELGMHPEWAVFRDVWRGLISGQTMMMMTEANLIVFKLKIVSI